MPAVAYFGVSGCGTYDSVPGSLTYAGMMHHRLASRARRSVVSVLIDVVGVVLGSLAFWRVSRSGLDQRSKSIVMVGICAATALAVFVASVRGRQLFPEFRESYYLAGKAVLDGRAALDPLVGVGIDRFVNLPVMAYLFAPLGLLSESSAAAVFTVVGVASVVAAWLVTVHLAALEGTRRWLLLFLFCANGPLLYSIRLGNTTHMLLLPLALGLYLLSSRRSLAAGVVLAIAALIKLPLLLFWPWLLLRRDWRAAAGFGAVWAVACALSLTLFGWDLHARWLEKTVWPYTTHPIGARNVQSVPAFFVRLVNEPEVISDYRPIRSPEPLQRLATIVVVGLLYAGAAAVSSSRRRRPQPRSPTGKDGREWEYLLVLTLAVVTSPLSWSHYYLLLLLPVAFLLSPRFAGEPWIRRLTWAGCVLATPAVLNTLHAPTALQGLYAKFLISHLLFAGLILFIALAWALTLVSGQLPFPERRVY